MKSLSKEVDQFVQDLKHPLAKEIDELRRIIIEANPDLAENIKWNAPNFSLAGEDRITLKLMPSKNIQIIFHRGAKVKDQPAQNILSDTPSFLSWAAKDRAVATFNNTLEIRDNKDALASLVKKWIEATT
jgi:hypothetical protein